MYKEIKTLVHYALHQGILDQSDYDYAINKLCDLFKLDTFIDQDIDKSIPEEPSPLLQPLLDYAVNHHLIEIDTTLNRDLFEAKIMDILIPRPSEVITQFNELWWNDTKKATDYFYHLSKKSNYIKTLRTDKNIIWKSKTPYGLFDMTINLSKPEKNPLDIINEKNKIDTNYPKCLLCKEHVGYAGRPGRVNHRIIPIELNEELFHLQYSPYVYYNEHCIVLQDQHQPMNVTEKTFKRLLDFVDQFPHYFLGSNAGLPIVGGSILSHEHYQGGNHRFALEDAEILSTHQINDVQIHKLKWPLSVVRLESTNRQHIIDVATKLFTYFEHYTNVECGIYAHTTAPHNAITPIARKEQDKYILNIALRNNLTSEAFPLGIFHPHPENHHIKKENIGLIEVMGLAVLPARLKEEIKQIKEAILTKQSLPLDNIHFAFVETLIQSYTNQDIDTFIKDAIAVKFTKCLENAGIFKQDDFSQHQFDLFIEGFIHDYNH